MQDDGAAIIMHGYTHQFYDSETGEGFEFWDVKTDQPIRQPKHEKPKTKDDFPNIEAYNQYVKKGKNSRKNIRKIISKKEFKNL